MVIALPLPCGATPQPSRIISASGRLISLLISKFLRELSDWEIISGGDCVDGFDPHIIAEMNRQLARNLVNKHSEPVVPSIYRGRSGRENRTFHKVHEHPVSPKPSA